MESALSAAIPIDRLTIGLRRSIHFISNASPFLLPSILFCILIILQSITINFTNHDRDVFRFARRANACSYNRPDRFAVLALPNSRRKAAGQNAGNSAKRFCQNSQIIALVVRLLYHKTCTPGRGILEFWPCRAKRQATYAALLPEPGRFPVCQRENTDFFRPFYALRDMVQAQCVPLAESGSGGISMPITVLFESL